MTKNTCKRCDHVCHCDTNDEHRIITDCECVSCNCPKNNVWNYEEDVVADTYENEVNKNNNKGDKYV
ncbi:MAG: hypothetical protein CMI58_04980 [Parcubacteria group bacterium]|jgi:hypothetical protein|nr:hypothetical protein [Parcubacteria group bacterium]|tara:strand:+ start:532 stop:732 length:201 start_codon:yes stop_codon:yes gene_type:complete